MKTTQWVPASDPYTPMVVPESPFRALQTPPLEQWLALRALPAAERRLYVPHFLEAFGWETLHEHLPLRVAPVPDGPAWPGRSEEYGEVTVVEERTVTIRDEETTIVVGEGTNSEGEPYRQASARFAGRASPALMVFIEPVATWEWGRVEALLESIR